MLTCGVNFKGTIPEVCRECQLVDNENHRLNQCPQWQDTNFANDDTFVEFTDIFSNNVEKLSPIIQRIQKVWEVHVGNGAMKKPFVAQRGNR